MWAVTTGTPSLRCKQTSHADSWKFDFQCSLGMRDFDTKISRIKKFSRLLFAPTKNWHSNESRLEEILKDRLQLYGHRNWLVIADSAYPAQSRPAIETIVAGEEQTRVERPCAVL